MKSLIVCAALITLFATVLTASCQKGVAGDGETTTQNQLKPTMSHHLIPTNPYVIGGVPVLINGKPVDKSDARWKPVVRIRTGSAGCSATVIGKRVLITAAHCARNGATTRFEYDGVRYEGKVTRSPLYPRQDHDIALAKLTQDFAGDPATVFDGELIKNDEVTLLGYGCTQPGGGGGNDGILRIGTTKVTRFSGYDVVSFSRNGAALCYGDSGGPGFIKNKDDQWVLWGVNSKGNIQDTNYNAYLRTQASKDFLTKFAADENVEICGVNKDCGKPPPPEPGTVVEFKGDAGEYKVEVKIEGLTEEFIKTKLGNLDRYLSLNKPPPSPNGGVGASK